MNRPPLALEPGELLGAITGTFCPLVFVALVSYLMGLYVFGPLYARAAWTPPRTRYGIVDILILLVQLQLAGGAALLIVPVWFPEAALLRYGSALAAWLLMGFWWWTGIRMLSLARVEEEFHRTMFLGLALPLGYLAAVVVMLTPLALVLLAVVLHQWIAKASYSAAAWCLALPAIYAAAFGVIPGVRWFCRRIADRARDAYAHEEGIDFGPVANRALGGLFRWHSPMASEREVRIVDEGPTPDS
jgi:hypothetical protein